MQLNISVIIPCYQSEETIFDTLKNLLLQKTKLNYEVIVVDSSTDATAQLVRKHFPAISLIHLTQRTLAAVARNIGAKKAQGEFLAFLDSDCLVDEYWLQTAFDTYSENYCCLGGPIENSNPVSAVSWAGYILEFSEFFMVDKAVATKHIPSANLFLKKSIFNEIGGFPERYIYAQEDRYFSWLLTKHSGQNFLLDPRLAVKHHHRSTFKEFFRHQQDIGQGGAEILKITDLSGHQLIKYRGLMLFILPLLPFKKLSYCLFRLLKFKPRLIFQYPALLPLLVIGMLYWGIGFASAIYPKFRIPYKKSTI